MNKNVTDSWKSEKLNACADSVDQALFSAPSKEPGYEATDRRSNTKNFHRSNTKLTLRSVVLTRKKYFKNNSKNKNKTRLWRDSN